MLKKVGEGRKERALNGCSIGVRVSASHSLIRKSRGGILDCNPRPVQYIHVGLDAGFFDPVSGRRMVDVIIDISIQIGQPMVSRHSQKLTLWCIFISLL